MPQKRYHLMSCCGSDDTRGTEPENNLGQAIALEIPGGVIRVKGKPKEYEHGVK